MVYYISLFSFFNEPYVYVRAVAYGSFFWWWFSFDAYAPRIFDTGGAIAGGRGVVAVLVAIAMSVWRSRQSKLVTTYGSARWANAEDIRKADLDQPAGVFLGLHQRQYLRHEGPEHVLTFAPTRSGKGVGLVVPTLLSWPASAVIHDIKVIAEALWNGTSASGKVGDSVFTPTSISISD